MRNHPCLVRTLALCLLAAFAAGGAVAASPTSTARTEWWRQARFGMFIHWGVYAVPADGEWHQYNHRMQVADYEKYPPLFNPNHFDAHAWVKAAKDAGMRYIVVTSKHHDGFSMFDTRQSDYSVVRATPWRHDPLKDLADECRRQGMRLGFYYSLMDWHHPDYLPRREWEISTRPFTGADWNRYIDYVKSQLTELLTNYGPVAVIWFDGGWEHSAKDWRSQELLDLIHRLQPDTLVNDRSNLPADFATPEQRIPEHAMSGGRLWETCMTMNNSWGYVRDDDNWKSPTTLIHNLADVASKGGNLLLNVGPTADGVFPPEATERLAAVGRWMRVNGSSIRGTVAGPFRKITFDGRVTRKGNSLFAHVFQWPDTGLMLAGLETPVAWARAVDGGERLSVTTGPTGVIISKPARLDPWDTVIEIRLKDRPIVSPPAPIAPSPDGVLRLTAQSAEIDGDTAHLETRGGEPNVGYWTNPDDTLAWYVDVPRPGEYRVDVEFACDPESAGGSYAVTGGEERVAGDVQGTGGWDAFTTARLDRMLKLKAGRSTIRLVPTDMPGMAVMNLRAITLTPVGDTR